MKIVDIIKNFFNNAKQKRLPPAELFTTNVIPVACAGEDRDQIATTIRDEINKYVDFYKVFLSEYDGICINKANNTFKNPLNIDDVHILKSMTFINPKDNSRSVHVNSDEDIKDQICANFERAMLSKYSAREIFFHLSDMREEYDRKLDYTYNSKENPDDFYRMITLNYNSPLYFRYLCKLKDWEGLKLLHESENDLDFCEKYIDKNLFAVLNKTVELYSDPEEDHFFENNINLISNAILSTRSHTINGFYKKINKELLNGLSKSKGIKFEVQPIDQTDGKFSKEKIIALVNNILDYIDNDKKLNSFFMSELTNGKIKISKEIADKACYNPVSDECIIPLEEKITDIPVIIHEFIHQYNCNHAGHSTYSQEVPSVYFEKVAIQYLINNGYSTYKDALNEYFKSRKENDACNNAMVIANIVDLTKRKHDDGMLTINNLISDKQVDVMNKLEFLIDKPKVMDISDIEGRKRIFAKEVIQSFAGRDRETIKLTRKLCSYSIGTYYAEEYCDDKEVSKKMLQLIDDPEYSLQKMIDSIENRDIEKEPEAEKELE